MSFNVWHLTQQQRVQEINPSFETETTATDFYAVYFWLTSVSRPFFKFSWIVDQRLSFLEKQGKAVSRWPSAEAGHIIQSVSVCNLKLNMFFIAL